MAATMKDLASEQDWALQPFLPILTEEMSEKKTEKKSRKLLKNFTMRSMRLPGILRQMQQKPLEW